MDLTQNQVAFGYYDLYKCMEEENDSDQILRKHFREITIWQKKPRISEVFFYPDDAQGGERRKNVKMTSCFPVFKDLFSMQREK